VHNSLEANEYLVKVKSRLERASSVGVGRTFGRAPMFDLAVECVALCVG